MIKEGPYVARTWKLKPMGKRGICEMKYGSRVVDLVTHNKRWGARQRRLGCNHVTLEPALQLTSGPQAPTQPMNERQVLDFSPPFPILPALPLL